MIIKYLHHYKINGNKKELREFKEYTNKTKEYRL